MDESLLEALARAAGLEAVWREFRADLLAAARQVEDQRRVISGAPPPTGDPWTAASPAPRDG